MNDYELMYVLHPRLTAEELESAVERISGQITGAGGEIVSVDQWGRRRLAYPIDRNLEGYYVLTTYNSEPSAGTELEAQLNLAEDVLRHLLIRGIIPYEGPPRDERPADRGMREPVRERPVEGSEGDAGETPTEVSAPVDDEAEAAAEPEAETTPPEQPEVEAPAEEVGEEEEQAAPSAVD
jgi:small subunit ribosomal protein S6